MKQLQTHPDRKDHVMVNLAAGGSMYIKPSDLKEITKKTARFTEVKYGQQRIRLFEPADVIQALIDANKESAGE